MKAPYTIFGETKMIEVVVYQNGQIVESGKWDEEIWIERGEDWYALGSSNFKNKKVRVITRDVWLRTK